MIVEDQEALVIGAGPAGLMAAEILSAHGHRVLIAEARPSPARKFLMAGKSGLNITKTEDPGRFLAAYAERSAELAPMLAAFGQDAVQDWARGLGQDLFVGSTGRVFPRAMKSSPLLRAWLGRLSGRGVELRRGWRWTGWSGDAAVFLAGGEQRSVRAGVTVLALGGASWARLGSDGSWAHVLAHSGVPLVPFAPSNAGLRIDWSSHMARHFGTPVKGISLAAGGMTSRGEVMISVRGLEGGGLYPLTPALREGATLTLDLKPDLTLVALEQRLTVAPSSMTASEVLRRRAGLGTGATALMQEFARPMPRGAELAGQIKSLVIRHRGSRPIDEAISTAGGIAWGGLDGALMLKARPGVFAAGEMLDWEAPTGGYLLTACLSTGAWAGKSAVAWLAQEEKAR